MANVYIDPRTGEWVGEYEYRNADGETHRETEWFASQHDAREFARKGRAAIVAIVRAKLPEFTAADLSDDVVNGFTIDGMPWKEWLDAMTMD